jgi:hypothetical protein
MRVMHQRDFDISRMDRVDQSFDLPSRSHPELASFVCAAARPRRIEAGDADPVAGNISDRRIDQAIWIVQQVGVPVRLQKVTVLVQPLKVLMQVAPAAAKHFVHLIGGCNLVEPRGQGRRCSVAINVVVARHQKYVFNRNRRIERVPYRLKKLVTFIELMRKRLASLIANLPPAQITSEKDQVWAQPVVAMEMLEIIDERADNARGIPARPRGIGVSIREMKPTDRARHSSRQETRFRGIPPGSADVSPRGRRCLRAHEIVYHIDERLCLFRSSDI